MSAKNASSINIIPLKVVKNPCTKPDNDPNTATIVK